MRTALLSCLTVLAAAASPVPATLDLRQIDEGSAAAPLLGETEPVRFVLRVAARCPDDEVLGALSVSLADTRLPVAARELDESGRIEVVLEVPATQLRGINERLLCSDNATAEGSLRLLRGAFSANASARCDHPERGSRTLYASTDVDVSYWCRGDQSVDDGTDN